jgi:hypothetical protein
VGNFSKFVRPGFYRIGASATDNNLQVSAYNDPLTGKFAIVVINPYGSLTTTFALDGFSANSVTPWVTSASLNLEPQPALSVNGSSFSYTLPASSVVTFVGQNKDAVYTVTPAMSPHSQKFSGEHFAPVGSMMRSEMIRLSLNNGLTIYDLLGNSISANRIRPNYMYIIQNQERVIGRVMVREN